MKKHLLKIVTLLIFASVAISSCSVEYRERHHHVDDHRYDEPHRY